MIPKLSREISSPITSGSAVHRHILATG